MGCATINLFPFIITTLVGYKTTLSVETCFLTSIGRCLFLSWLREGGMQMYGWTIAFGVSALLTSLIFGFNYKSKNTRWSVINMVLANLTVFLLVMSVCFHGGSTSWPFVAFLVCFVLYLMAEFLFVFYHADNFLGSFARWLKNLISFFGINPLKGWGGETFGDFTNGMGVMATASVYLVYTENDGSSGLWWAAQLAALLSVMGAAAWLQRFYLEKLSPGSTRDEAVKSYTSAQVNEPVSMSAFLHESRKTDTPNDKGKQRNDRISIGISMLVTFMSALAMIIPTMSNMQGISTQPNAILIIWAVVFLVWLFVAIYVYRKVSEDKGWDFTVLYLLFPLLMVLISPTILWWRNLLGTPGWSNDWGVRLAMITATICLIGQIFRMWYPVKEWLYPTNERKESYSPFWKDLFLSFGCLVIFYFALRYGDDLIGNEALIYVGLLILTQGIGSAWGVIRGALRLESRWAYENWLKEEAKLQGGTTAGGVREIELAPSRR